MADSRLHELAALIPGTVTELDAVAIAIAIEEAWGLTLSDEEITPQRLGTLQSIELLLRQHGEGL